MYTYVNVCISISLSLYIYIYIYICIAGANGTSGPEVTTFGEGCLVPSGGNESDGEIKGEIGRGGQLYGIVMRVIVDGSTSTRNHIIIYNTCSSSIY